ncbi:AMP-binding protein [Streptomyces sp. GbtcB7]|uniref:AMP-binding protein n=1 Tax=Streptomyces sp. GbtcB7 TaxID=2824752 RepID=UPI001C30C68E|nr:AMP-binding protein [Streptomyces sp. GbtcB7]
MEYRLADEPRRHARERGAAPALSVGERTVTYAELDERTSRMAQALRASGAVPGSRIAVLDRSSIEVAETLLASAKIGAVTVPLNWRLAVPELRAVMEDARPVVLIVHEDFLPAALEAGKGLDPAPSVVVVGAEYERWIGRQPARDPLHEGHPGDVVAQLYTWGTTGRPKGVLTTDSNVGALVQAGRYWAVDSSTKCLDAMPLFHIGGLGMLLIVLAAGGHSVLVRELVPEELLATLEEAGITNTFLVPTAIQTLVDLPGADTRDYSQLRSIAYGSSPATPALLRKAAATFGCPLFQTYGLTESTGVVVQLDAADHDPGGPREYLLRSVGKPYPWAELKIVDAEGATLPSDTPGEICIRSQQNSPGYYNRPEETAAAIDADGWLRTGDVGRLDPDGYLFISDRMKDMIITGGENVYPVEVEAVLADHPEVASVAVIGRPDTRWGEAVTAVVVRSTGSEVGQNELIAFARERLAGYKCPKRIEFVNALPVGPTGKVLKRALRTAH